MGQTIKRASFVVVTLAAMAVAGSALFAIPCFAQTKLLFVVFLYPNPASEELPKERVDSLMAGHMANINRLAREQKLLAAGPFDGGGGIFVFGAGSKAEVGEWLNHPVVRNGVVSMTMKKIWIARDSFCEQ